MTEQAQWGKWSLAARDSLLYRDGRPVAMCASPQMARELYTELAARAAVALPIVRAEQQRREDLVAELRRHMTALERQRDRLSAEIAELKAARERPS